MHERDLHRGDSLAPFLSFAAGPSVAFAVGLTTATMAAVASLFLTSSSSLPTVPPGSPIAGPAGHDRSHEFLSVLISLTTIIVTGQVIGRLFSAIGQPPVIGEICAGILLGPSLFGRVFPNFALFDDNAGLSAIAHLGAVVYMFLVGLELDVASLRRQARTTFVAAHASIFVPFIAGIGLAYTLYPGASPPGVQFPAFALFVGVSLSITAFPVLARILADIGLANTPLGLMAIGCAAVIDAAAWCMLALVIGVVRADLGSGVQTLGLVTLYLLGVIAFLRPTLQIVVRRSSSHMGNSIGPGIIILLMFMSAAATDAIGIHAILGAFVVGALIPHESPLAEFLTRRLSFPVASILMPAFFAVAGLRTEINLISGWTDWAVCGFIIVCASAGKIGGTLAGARLSGLSWRDATALGVLMNTRGLVELIVLNVGLEIGVISPRFYAMMVVMTLATTLMTGPLLRRLGYPGAARPDSAARPADQFSGPSGNADANREARPTVPDP
jgi:Kef-type K+ transport system membrane component KefB